MSEIDRTDVTREKTGVFTGAYAINPADGEEIPVYIADYVLMGYGTGAIMAVPAHDERDFEFARKYGIEIRTVIAPPDWDGEDLAARPTPARARWSTRGGFDGTPSAEGKERVTAWLEERGDGKAAVTYRLHDWLISRQRYWGTPIPIIFCDECGIVPVPEEDLPVLLPEEAEFMPTGESPLKLDPDFYNTECPGCGGPATRETDTMDTFMDSSWYWYRYLSPHYDEGPFDPETGREVAAGRPVHRRHRARHTAPALRPLLHQGDEGPRAGRLRRADDPPAQPGDHTRARRAEDEQEPRQRGQPAGVRGPLRLRRAAGLPDVHRPVERGRSLGRQGHRGRLALAQARPLAQRRGDSSGGEADPAELPRRTNRLIKKLTEDLEAFRFNTSIAALMEHTNYLLAIKGQRRGGGVARGLAELRHGSRPVRAAPRRGDVGRDGGGVLGARAGVAALRGGPDPGRRR